MKQFEYLVVWHKDSNTVKDTLDKHGIFGWELIVIIPERFTHALYFKREINRG